MDTTKFLNYDDHNEVIFSDLDPGGHWKPTDCAPRRRIAILIPYRDREQHLMDFMIHTHPILQRQLVEYQIFLIEQVTNVHGILTNV